ncbi:bacterial extracellular solute-binding family protein [Paraburkholderia fungorum]|jgi:putative spermidine/putrescine transport system substrate-binding protein|uniref:Bacterial extracellular solute-binding family protein n=1 Tax=Paraburkholderia fungorum TaxID=134537 RepID=A0AAJ3VSG1_9BURK|nr:extracellular solute-binding protein [Paraburkholderia fungorum]KFX65127.1 spermidine/putrescine ABC transporter substrate-binding protein [Burkholderia sp. K24]AJZ63901.1 bacterial extracellular solute-binding family protein [Paraburkholderia fungorum]MBU7439999.1 extracellular solute-binding protein [Paraburkholderia fungorum]MDT8839068.1 extracellular solute-binding protein [Paraburkholderia fungorum]PNE54397.1 spermidine/putrescine ABC transporter substrate-binding protein [Paraburkhold
MLTISMADEMRCFKPSLRCRFAVAAARLNSLGSRGFSGFLTLLINAAICASLLSSAPVAAAGNVLRVLAWPGYADADVVKTFETRYNAKVEVTWVDSDEALWAQMHAQDTPPFDVLAANTAEIERYTRANLLAPLDLTSLPNTKKQLARFQARSSIEGLTSAGQVYAIPFTYSSMGLIYDRKQFAVAPRSMRELWNPRYRGKVLDFNSAQHNFSFTALALGYPHPFQLDATQMRVIARKLVDLRRNLLTYYTVPEEATAYFVQHKVALMFGNYGTQQVESLRRAGADVGYVIPDEGALAWLDCWAMTRSARDRELALAWINYMIEPDVSALLTQRQGLANTLTAPAEGNDQAHIVWIGPVEDIQRREELWTRIVSGDRSERF